MSRDEKSMLPLSEPVYHILMALSDEPRHGYAILQEVERRTGGAVVLRTGTLYTAIKRLLEQQFIAETPAPEPDTDERRRYYRLTTAGRRLLEREAERLAAMVDLAREKRVLAEGN